MTPQTSVTLPTRWDAVDALRGLAMVWMTVFHFCFDLNHFGYWLRDFYRDPFWVWQRTLILSLFLFCAGMGQAIAVVQGQNWARFWQRWRQVLACALLVSAGSWLMYPQTFIYFGVLHAMAVLLLLARWSVRWAGSLWWVGGMLIAIKYIAVYALKMGANDILIDLLNAPWLNWVGLVTRLPVTEDYVPLLPWAGVVCWGVAAGSWLARSAHGAQVQSIASALKPLAALGRWSLTYYMLHQPFMIACLMALGWIVRK